MRYLQRPLSSTLALAIAIAATAVAAPSLLKAERANVFQNAASDSCACADGPQAEQERALGRVMALHVLQRSLPWGGNQLNDYIDRLGKRLASASGTRQVFQFQVLYSSEVNAQAFSGGYIFLNSGAITAAHDEAELAAILAHEIAHLNASHCRGQTRKSLAYRLFRAIALASGTAVAGPTGESGSRFVRARLRREEEQEADRLAVIYLAKAGYDPQAAARLFGRLEELETQAGTKPDARLSSHPPLGDRRLQTERLATTLATSQPLIEDTAEFEAARAEVLRYNEVYATATGESLPGQPCQPPKLVQRTDGGW